jgi:predicted RNase H-like nuclease (RuvC/YqgF family)
MTKEPEFFDEIFIKLRRQYGKDELVADLVKRLKDRDVEIGKLKAEIDFLNNELIDKEFNEKVRIQVRKEELYNIQLSENKRLIKEVKELKKKRDRLRYELRPTK